MSSPSAERYSGHDCGAEPQVAQLDGKRACRQDSWQQGPVILAGLTARPFSHALSKYEQHRELQKSRCSIRRRGCEAMRRKRQIRQGRAQDNDGYELEGVGCREDGRPFNRRTQQVNEGHDGEEKHEAVGYGATVAEKRVEIERSNMGE